MRSAGRRRALGSVRRGGLEATTGFEPVIRVLQTPALPLGHVAGWTVEMCWSGRRDSNPRPSPWQGDALPLRHFRSPEQHNAAQPGHCTVKWLRLAPFAALVPRRGLEPPRPQWAQRPQRCVSTSSTTSAATVGCSGRGGRTRTRDLRFWRPLLCQTELHPSVNTEHSS